MPEQRDKAPVIRVRCYTLLPARTLHDKDAEKDKHMGHLVLLAKNNQGYRNLMKIVSEAYRHGFYYKPRVDKDLLRQHSDGIIALSACLAGEVQYRLMNRDYDGAEGSAGYAGDIRRRELLSGAAGIRGWKKRPGYSRI